MLGLFLLAAGGGLLFAGAELFAEHAQAAGRRLGVTALAIGILLAGAEPEELVTAVVAAGRDRPGLAVGDAVGANLIMLTLVLGVASIIRPLPFGRRVARYAALAAIAAGAALAALATGAGISRAEGIALAAVYLVIVAAVWRVEQEPPAIGELGDDEGDEGDDRWAPLLVLAGVAVMGAGGWVAVTGAERVVDALGTDDERVGLTLVALATTLELVALVVASARRQVSELAVAAVLGSAIYNSTLTLGAAAVVTPLPAGRLTPAAAMAVALPVAVLALSGPKRTIGRVTGAFLAAAYAAVAAIAVA